MLDRVTAAEFEPLVGNGFVAVRRGREGVPAELLEVRWLREPPTLTNPSAPVSVNASTFAVQGAAEANSLVQVYNDVNNNGVIDAGDTVVASQQLSGGVTTFSISVALSQDAANTFVVTATDAVANASAAADVPPLTAVTLSGAVAGPNGLVFALNSA